MSVRSQSGAWDLRMHSTGCRAGGQEGPSTGNPTQCSVISCTWKGSADHEDVCIRVPESFAVHLTQSQSWK